MSRRVLMAEVSEGWVRGRQRLSWMDGVKVALGNKGMTVEAERKIQKSGEQWYISNWTSFKQPFFLDPVFFRTTLPCSGGYHLDRGETPLHDAVGINCKKDRTTENQGTGVKYMGKWVYVDDCVCVIWLDMTTPPLWREKVMVYYYYIPDINIVHHEYLILLQYVTDITLFAYYQLCQIL